MYGLREALAAVLGVGFGLFVLAYPNLLLRAWSMHRPDRQPGPTGQTATDAGVLVWVIRAVGVFFVLGGLFFAVRPLV